MSRDVAQSFGESIWIVDGPRIRMLGIPFETRMTVVRLSDGRVGICIDHTPADPCRPVVQIIEDIADVGPDLVPTDEVVQLTAHDEGLYVTHCDGQEVAHLNFPRPTLMRESIEGLILKKRGKVGLL